MTDDSTGRGLAPVYGRAVELREAGASDETIALTLGVAVEAVSALIDVAVRKQARRANSDEPQPDIET